MKLNHLHLCCAVCILTSDNMRPHRTQRIRIYFAYICNSIATIRPHNNLFIKSNNNTITVIRFNGMHDGDVPVIIITAATAAPANATSLDGRFFFFEGMSHMRAQYSSFML